MDKIEDQEAQVILDSRGPYESDDMSVSNSFHLWLQKGIFRLYINMLTNIVKPSPEVPKSKVPKSRPKGLGLTQ